MMDSTHRDKARVGAQSPLTWSIFWSGKIPTLSQESKLDPRQPLKRFSSQDCLLRRTFSTSCRISPYFEPVDGRIRKKMPRYQQFRAVHKTIERIKTGKSRKEKSGVIWHTQGSGKSLTMVFLTLKIRRDLELRDYKLVFLTDRTQLDNQLTTTFRNAQDETVRHANSVK